MGEVVDLNTARARKGLPRVEKPRPTLAEAAREYDWGTFHGAMLVNDSPIAHRPRFGLPNMSSCGLRGIVKPAPQEALVCLRCWPWWKA